jgi:hypothetical protein
MTRVPANHEARSRRRLGRAPQQRWKRIWTSPHELVAVPPDPTARWLRNQHLGPRPSGRSDRGCRGSFQSRTTTCGHKFIAVIIRVTRVFQARRDYQTGSDSDSVAIGDLNGDGKPDLATASAAESTISVLANRGEGSFQAARHFPTGGADSPVAIGDLNGDGKPDLATTEGAPVEAAPDGGVWVLLNATGLCAVPNLTEPQGEDAPGREADACARPMRRREDRPRLLESGQEGPRDL